MYLKILLVGGNYFHANYLLSLKTDAQKNIYIYISLLHIVAKKFSLTQVHTVKRVCYFGNKKRLDLYLMVQKNLLRSTFTWYYLFSVFHRTKRWKNCEFWWISLSAPSIRCIIIPIFFEKSESCPTIMNKETRDDNSLTVTLGFSR